MEQHKEQGCELAFKYVPKSVGSVAVRKSFMEAAKQARDLASSTELSIDEVLTVNETAMKHG